jgi:hypothetical protein
VKIFKDPGVNITEMNRFSPPEDKQRFTLLVKVIRIQLKLAKAILYIKTVLI